jgi:hypothetical protein
MGMGSERHDPATLPRGIIPATHCKWGLSGSPGRSEPVWKRGNFLDPPRFQPRRAQPVASPHIVYVTPTPYLDRSGMKLWTPGQIVWWKSSQLYSVLCIVKVIRLRTTTFTVRVACMGFGWSGFQDVLTERLPERFDGAASRTYWRVPWR